MSRFRHCANCGNERTLFRVSPEGEAFEGWCVRCLDDAKRSPSADLREVADIIEKATQ